MCRRVSSSRQDRRLLTFALPLTGSSFAADRQFKDKFERLAEVLGVENPLQHMVEIMEQVLDRVLSATVRDMTGCDK